MISVILVSHNKPVFCRTAIESVRTQTYANWELQVVDSGVLADGPYFEDFHKDPRIIISVTGEEPDLGQRFNAHSFIVNRVLNNRPLEGELILFLCDDDWFYPWAFDAIHRFYWEAPGRHCMYGSVHLARSDAAGVTNFYGERLAEHARGKACGGLKLDCEVDYLQFVFSQKALADYRAKFGDEILSERLEHKGHADGIFMERMGEIHPVYAIPAWLGMNRRTPQSVFVGA